MTDQNNAPSSAASDDVSTVHEWIKRTRLSYKTHSPADAMERILIRTTVTAATLRTLLDNLLIAQSLSKEVRSRATDEARTYLYNTRKVADAKGEGYRMTLVEKQPFERFPELAAHIERMASTGAIGGMISWDAFLRELNAALTPRHEAPAAPCASHRSMGFHIDPCCPHCEAPAEGAGEEVRAVLVEGIAHDLGVSIAALGHPVGMGLAPSDDACRKAASRILDRIAPAAIDALRARSSAPEAREGEAVAWASDVSMHALSHARQAIVSPVRSEVAGDIHALYTHPAAPSADKLRASTGTHWRNPDNDEEGFSCWGDAFEDATFNGWDAPVRLERAKRLPDVWAVRIDIDTTGDGEADDYEIRLFDTEVEALAALKAEGC